MTVVTGDIRLVTDKPDSVSQLWLRAPRGRVQGTAYVTESPDTIQVTGGAVSFDALPGAMVMTLVSHGAPLQTVKLLVPDKTSATLAECIEAAELATDGTRSALERLALEVQAELGQVPSLVSDALAQDSAIIDAAAQAVDGVVSTKWDEKADKSSVDAALEVKADKSYVDGSKWLQASLPADADFDTLRTPALHIIQGGTHPSAPFNTLGALEVLPIINGGVVQRATNWSTLDVWKRTTRGGVFQEWVKEPRLADVDTLIQQAIASIEIPDITEDLAAKADISYVDESKWVQTNVPSNANYDELRTPSVRIMMAPGAEAVNPPFNNIGIFEVLPTAYSGIVQRATNWGTLEVWQRRTQGGVFQAWVKQPSKADLDSLNALIPTDAEIQSKIDDAISDYAGAVTSDWTRRVPLAVTTGAGPSEGPGAGTYRIRTQFTAPITRWRLHVSTRYPIFPTIRDGASIQNVSIGENLGDGNIGAATGLAANVDIAAGNEWVSTWQTYDLTTDSLISMDVTPSGSHYNLLAPAWKDGVQVNRAPLWVWIEAETYTDTPTVALIGDSTGAGHGSIEPVWDSAVAIAGRKQEFLPVLYSNSGDTLSGNTTIDDINFTRWEGFKGYDSVVIQAGSNDIHASDRTLEVMQDNFVKAVDVAKQLGVKVYAATIKPRYPSDTKPDVRVPYNEWLKTLPAGISGVIDYDKAIAPDGVVLPEDNDDGAHLKSSGHHKMATAYSYPVARPRIVGTWKP